MADNCIHVTRDMLTDPIHMRVSEELDLTEARTLADRKAGEVSGDPMLLAWYDRKRGIFSPDVACCGEDKPAWLIYAESRGGNITVDINDEEYVFVYYDYQTEGQ
jgi:hypothetical protein